MIHIGNQAISILLLIGLCAGAAEKSLEKLDVAAMGPIARASAPGEDIRQLWAYADPDDGRYMIACGMFSEPESNVSHGFVYSSSDAGASWHRTLLDDASRWVSEESCAYGHDGRAYFVDGQSDTSSGLPRHEWGHLQVFVSGDHGMTWKPSGRGAFVDWTMSVALPANKQHAETLAIFGNEAADSVGHWGGNQPVALEATDGAQTLSALVTPPSTSTRNFGGGSVALSDRTALFAVGVTDPAYASNPAQHRRLNVFAYKPSERSLEVRATLRNEPGRSTGLPFIVRDTSRRFRGRLYAAWSEIARPGSDAQLWLASSEDNGYHWSSRPILSMPDYRTPPGCPTDIFTRQPDVRIAVNRAGLLGVLWTQDGQTLLFAVSVDGGHTFKRGQLAVRQSQGELSVHEAVPFNEHWLAENIVFWQGTTTEVINSFMDVSHLGLSVRLSKQTPIKDFELTADAKNSFHALWTGTGSDGHYALMTRAINVTSANGATNSTLTSTAAPSTCGEDTSRLQPDKPSPAPPLDIAGHADVSGFVNLQVDHVDYAAESHIVTARMTVMNKTEDTLRGPLSFFGVGLHSDFGIATPLNASGTKQGHPFWNLSTVIPADGLPPKASSKPIELQFKIDQFHSVPTGDAVAMQVRIFADHATQSDP